MYDIVEMICRSSSSTIVCRVTAMCSVVVLVVVESSVVSVISSVVFMQWSVVIVNSSVVVMRGHLSYVMVYKQLFALQGFNFFREHYNTSNNTDSYSILLHNFFLIRYVQGFVEIPSGFDFF